MSIDGIVLVTGATGQQGGAVARQLQAAGAGAKVRAMTRHPEGEKARELAALGLEIVRGDLDDRDSLARAVRGAWGVHGVQNTWEAGVEREEAQGKRLVEVARENNVYHYVYSSVGSAHRRTGIPHFDNKWRVEESLRAAAFPSWTVLRPVFFMENLLGPFFKPSIDQGTLRVALDPKTKLQMIAVADIGKYGRLAFEEHQRLNGREIDIAGDAKTMPEVAEILSRVTGRRIGFERLPIEVARSASQEYAIMLEWFDAVGYDADIEGNAREFGIRPTPFEEWARTVRWD
ncbi:MAG: NmrA/HSCARG family protein [Candidatus Eisenbacteria bacterium]|nr:NmrA/HSCARG family protein [Candidatus Eisenbacteria bacterium]